MAWLRSPVGMLCLANRSTVKRHQSFLEACSAVGLVGDEENALPDGERPEIEGLVVQNAKGQPVVLCFWSARLMPPDVRGVQGDRHRSEPHVEAANGVAVFIGSQHPVAEGRIALPPGYGRFERQPDRIQDVLMKRLREMFLENPRRDSRRES